MPTIIDELIVTLGLDGTNFRNESEKTAVAISKTGRAAQKEGKELEDNLRKSQDATQKRMKQGEEVGRQTSQQFNKFRIEIAALFTTLATGFGLQQFIKGMTDSSAATGRLAANIGISTKDLSIWQEAAKRTGGSAEGLGSSLLGLAQEHEKLALVGNSEMLPFLRELRVQWSDTTGAMRPMNDILFDLNAAVQGMDKRHANALLAGLGFDQGTINLLESSKEELTKYLAEAERLGVVSDKDAKASITYQNAILDLKQAFSSLGRTILTDALPQITAFIKTLTEWAADPANAEFIKKEAMEDLKVFGSAVLAIVDTIKEWKTVAEALALYIGGRWLLAMTIGLGPVGLAIAGIAAGFLAIRNTMQNLDPTNYSADSPLWNGISKEQQLQYPQSPESRRAAGREGDNLYPFQWWNPGSWGNRPSGTGGASDEKKEKYRDRLQQDLGISREAASGIIGNINYESGMEGINEKNPLVPGSRGGFGWAQWTGERRDQFESYSKEHGLDVKSDDANYGFLIQELRSKYPDVLAQLKKGGITAAQAADIVARGYEKPANDASFAGRATTAENVAKLGTKDYVQPQMTPSAGMKADEYYKSMTRYLDEFSKQRASDRIQQDNRAPASAPGHVETNINGPITVQGAADADGIAKNIGASLKKYAYVPQANTGLV